jgi:hypothetical protein
MADKKTYVIPMFLGVSTITDSYELAEYIKKLCATKHPASTKLSNEFDAKFPGLRMATVLALKEICAAVPDGVVADADTHLEFIDGQVRATYKDTKGPWHRCETPS